MIDRRPDPGPFIRHRYRPRNEVKSLPRVRTAVLIIFGLVVAAGRRRETR